jgi:hypothetical protein
VALTPAGAIRAWEVDTLNAPAMAREAQIKLAGQRTIRVEEVVADYLQSLRELGLPKPDPAGTKFSSPDHASCPHDARGCASAAAIRQWLELAGVLPKDVPTQQDGKGKGKKGKTPAAADSAGGVAGTNLVAYNRIPRSMALDAIHAYLKAVAMEAPEKLTPDVLKSVVADMPREALETRRYTVVGAWGAPGSGPCASCLEGLLKRFNPLKVKSGKTWFQTLLLSNGSTGVPLRRGGDDRGHQRAHRPHRGRHGGAVQVECSCPTA